MDFRKVALVLGIAALLAGCDGAVSVGTDEANEAPSGDSDTVLKLYGGQAALAKVAAEYAAIKQGVREQIAKEDAACAEDPEGCRELWPPSKPVPSFPYVVFDCGSYGEIPPTLVNDGLQSASAMGLLTAATGAVLLERSAMRFRYPEPVWKPALTHYEAEAQLNALRVRFLEAREKYPTPWYIEYPTHVVTDLIAYQEQVDPSLERLLDREGCGAGEFDVKVHALGATALHIIPEFFAQVCLHEVGSLDRPACRYWTAAPLSEVISVSGAYRYDVQWRNGKRTTGNIDFDRIGNVDAGDDDTPTFMIRP